MPGNRSGRQRRAQDKTRPLELEAEPCRGLARPSASTPTTPGSTYPAGGRAQQHSILVLGRGAVELAWATMIPKYHRHPSRHRPPADTLPLGSAAPHVCISGGVQTFSPEQPPLTRVLFMTTGGQKPTNFPQHAHPATQATGNPHMLGREMADF